jgi:hypothetical protein
MNADDMMKPVLWSWDPEDSSSSGPVELPTLAGGEGQILSLSDIVVLAQVRAGVSETAMGVDKAVVWTQEDSEWVIKVLPHYGPGLPGMCYDLAPDDSLYNWACGWVQDAESNRIPTVWRPTVGGENWDRLALPPLEGGSNGEACSFFWDGIVNISACGWSETAGGDHHAALWRSTNGGQSWSVTDLGTLSGMTNSIANDFLLAETDPPDDAVVAVGSSAGGSGPSQATIWQQDGGMCLNLNDLVVGPQELNLRTANVVSIDPGPIAFIVAGTGMLIEPMSGGRPDGPHAYVLTQVGTTGIEETTIPDLNPRCLFVEATPNPFTEVTSISFDLPSPGAIRLSVYDVLGRRVTALAERFQMAGRHTLSWTGSDATGNLVPAGVYVVRLEHEGGIQTKKVVRAVR